MSEIIHGGDVYRNKVNIDFSVSINPCGVPPKVKDALTNAIDSLEKYPDNFTIYNMLGHLYSTSYQDKYKEKQIFYLRRAFELAPQNRVVVKNLAYVYGKFDEVAKADEMYAKLMYLNPTHSDLHAYGAYLVDIANGL